MCRILGKSFLLFISQLLNRYTRENLEGRTSVKSQLTFRKELGLIDLTFASLGGIIGSGWILAALNAATVAGPGSIISWMIGGFAVILLGLVYSELGGMLPETGGVVRYPQYSHGTMVSWVMGWAAWLTYVTVAPTEAVAVVQISSSYIPNTMKTATVAGSPVSVLTTSGFLFAALLTLAFLLVNYYGIRIFKKINTSLTWFKLVFPAAVAVIVLVMAHHFSNFTKFGGFMPYHFSSSLTAVGTTGIVFAFLGFRQATDLAGEAKNPGRDIPRALIISIALGIIVYLLLEVAFVVGISPSALAHYGWGNLAKYSVVSSFPFAGIVGVLGLGWLVFLLNVDGWISPIGTGVVYTATSSRLVFALAENGYLPPGLLKLHPKFRVPYVALIVNFIIGLISFGPFPSWVQLVGFVSITGFFAYVMGPISLMVLRRTAPDIKRPVRLGGANVIALLAFIVASLIIYWASWAFDKYALGAITIGVVIYFIMLALGKGDWEDVKSGIWLVFYIAAMALVSFFGSKTFGGQNVLKAPWDTVTIAVLSVIFFYWAVASGHLTQSAKEVIQNQKEIS